MDHEYLSLTDLGKQYGVSSHAVGKWLKGLGLRTDSGQPSVRAFNEGFVLKHPSTQPGTYFFIWHASRTTNVLDAMGYSRSVLQKK